MAYQVIAFDLDGTLLNSQGAILAANKKALKQAQEKGVKVVLVSGRHHTAMKPYYAELGLDTPIICCNGTYIYHPATNEVQSANPLSRAACEQMLKVAEKYDIDLLMYSRDAMNFIKLNPHMQKFTQWANSCDESVRPDVRQVADFSGIIHDPKETIWKFVISSPNRQNMESAVAELPVSEFSCEWSWVDRVDCAKSGNSKGTKLLELLQMWHIAPENVIAFGDNHNDISMLTAVGLGVAMGNAEEKVKAQAKRVIGNNDEDSIAQLLSQLLAE